MNFAKAILGQTTANVDVLITKTSQKYLSANQPILFNMSEVFTKVSSSTKTHLFPKNSKFTRCFSTSEQL